MSCHDIGPRMASEIAPSSGGNVSGGTPDLPPAIPGRVPMDGAREPTEPAGPAWSPALRGKAIPGGGGPPDMPPLAASLATPGVMTSGHHTSGATGARGSGSPRGSATTPPPAAASGGGPASPRSRRTSDPTASPRVARVAISDPPASPRAARVSNPASPRASAPDPPVDQPVSLSSTSSLGAVPLVASEMLCSAELPSLRPASPRSRRISDPTAGLVAAGLDTEALRRVRRLLDIRVGNKFRVLEQLGAGAFGEIYRGKNMMTGDQVAIKIESMHVARPQLLDEARVCKMLGPDGPRGTPPDVDPAGIPRVWWYGIEGDFHVMIVELLGPSLEDLFNYCERRFSIQTTCAIGRQMVSRLEYFHSKHMLHRDVKPDNFLTGVGRRAGIIYLIDYGLGKPYRDPLTLRHVPWDTGKGLTGTARYAGVNVHMGFAQGRRDDLESLAYTLLYFVRGGLPWETPQRPAMPRRGQAAQPAASPANARAAGSPREPKEEKYRVPPAAGQAPGAAVTTTTGTKGTEMSAVQKRLADDRAKKERQEAVRKWRKWDDDRTKYIGFRKLNCSLDELCRDHDGDALPELGRFLEYCRNLRYRDKPDYEYLRDLLHELGARYGASAGDPFDWVVRGQREMRAAMDGRRMSMSMERRRRVSDPRRASFRRDPAWQRRRGSPPAARPTPPSPSDGDGGGDGQPP